MVIFHSYVKLPESSISISIEHLPYNLSSPKSRAWYCQAGGVFKQTYLRFPACLAGAETTK